MAQDAPFLKLGNHSEEKRKRTDAVLDFYRLARKKNYSRKHIVKMLDFVEWIIQIPKHEQ